MPTIYYELAHYYVIWTKIRSLMYMRCFISQILQCVRDIKNGVTHFERL